jgi:acyl carrier protein
MELNKILEEVNIIFIDVLEEEGIVITNETTASDIDEWDSLNHIQLVVAIEKKYHIKFTAHEIRNWVNVGEICKSIFSKLS